jgi:hypothetical protein
MTMIAWAGLAAVVGACCLASACSTTTPKRPSPDATPQITGPSVRPEDPSYRLTLLRSREETLRERGAKADGELSVRVERVAVTSTAVRAGETLTVSAEYVVLGPDASAPVSFRVRHDVLFVGQSWRRFTRDITAPQGTYKADLAWPVPADATDGPYEFAIEVETGGREAARAERAPFTVVSQPAAGPQSPPPAAAAPVPAPPARRTMVEVAVESAKIRREPTANSPIFATVPRGTRLELLEERPREAWGIKVNTQAGEPGWMQTRDVIIRR